MTILLFKVWEACSDASISFSGEDGEPLSYLVENDLTQLSLNSVLEQCPNLSVVYGAKVERYSIPEQGRDSVPADRVGITLSNGDTVDTQLLVGADGNR